MNRFDDVISYIIEDVSRSRENRKSNICILIWKKGGYEENGDFYFIDHIEDLKELAEAINNQVK